MSVIERAEKIRADVMQQGRVEGRIEGKLEGKFEGERKFLRVVMASRKLALTDEEHARIEACGDEDILKFWLQNALIASTCAEVFAERSPPPDAE